MLNTYWASNCSISLSYRTIYRIYVLFEWRRGTCSGFNKAQQNNYTWLIHIILTLLINQGFSTRKDLLLFSFFYDFSTRSKRPIVILFFYQGFLTRSKRPIVILGFFYYYYQGFPTYQGFSTPSKRPIVIPFFLLFGLFDSVSYNYSFFF